MSEGGSRLSFLRAGSCCLIFGIVIVRFLLSLN